MSRLSCYIRSAHGNGKAKSKDLANWDFVKQQNLFKLLSSGLEVLIRNANPWWRGEALSGVPPFQRWPFGPVIDSLRAGMTPATVLRGPRQIGKTTLLAQIVQRLLADGVAPTQILRLQFDDVPELKKLSMPLIELVDMHLRPHLARRLAAGGHSVVTRRVAGGSAPGRSRRSCGGERGWILLALHPVYYSCDKSRLESGQTQPADQSSQVGRPCAAVASASMRSHAFSARL